MSKNAPNANKDDGGTAFQTADEIRDEKDAGEYVPREVEVHDVTGARLAAYVVAVPDYDGEPRRMIFTEEEARQLLEGFGVDVSEVDL
jgi:hypothetical protein